MSNQDYLLTGEDLQEIIDQVEDLIDTKVSYNNDKLKMAEDCIGNMIVKARLFHRKLVKLRGCLKDEINQEDLL